MIWKYKEKGERNKIGTRKEVDKTAWFPTRLDNGDIVWLEKIIVTYEWQLELSYSLFSRQLMSSGWKKVSTRIWVFG